VKKKEKSWLVFSFCCYREGKSRNPSMLLRNLKENIKRKELKLLHMLCTGTTMGWDYSYFWKLDLWTINRLRPSNITYMYNFGKIPKLTRKTKIKRYQVILYCVLFPFCYHGRWLGEGVSSREPGE
jgi:hypothetical protein